MNVLKNGSAPPTHPPHHPGGGGVRTVTASGQFSSWDMVLNGTRSVLTRIVTTVLFANVKKKQLFILYLNKMFFLQMWRRNNYSFVLYFQKNTGFMDASNSSFKLIFKSFKSSISHTTRYHFWLFRYLKWRLFNCKCFPLTYDLNGCKFRINRHLLTVGSF